jgi:hypothetical protein
MKNDGFARPRRPKRRNRIARKSSSSGCDSGKIRYRSKKEALRALHTIQNTPGDQKPCRAYECFACNGWHLTSWETPSG